MSLLVQLKTHLANRKNYGNKRNTSTIKYIVIHYTANDGDTDENNGKYFHNNVTGSSAHYFVDDDSITQSVPDNYVAWHCGGKTYRHGTCRNSNSIGIEICDDVKNGTIYPSAKTIENVINLTQWLMEKYNIPKQNVIRHYDVTGKLCPAYWCGNSTKNTKWKTEFHNKLGTSNTKPMVVITPTNKGGNKVTITLNTIKTGSKGDNVKALQILLNGKGFSCGKADGIVGVKTVSAIKQFQKNSGLTTDGICGANTWTMLLK